MLHDSSDIVTNLAGLFAALVTVAAAWAAGCCIAPRRPGAERLASGLVALLAVCAVPMAQPLAGVSLLGHAWLLRLLGVALLAGALAWRRPRVWPPPRPHRAWLGVAAAGVLVSLPQLLDPRAVPTGDILWHEGWTRQ